MKKYLYIYLLLGALWLPVTHSTAQNMNWKEEIKELIPYLGHRNWIVITDMAYPLQSEPGIKTIYTGTEYADILAFVNEEIEKAPHIKPIIYQDKELLYLSDTDANGVDSLKESMNRILGNQVQYIPHEELIARLDSVGKTFTVVILKSTLTIPYTSTFFELDCNYWESEKQKALEKRLKAN